MRATAICDASFCHRSLAAGWAFWITFDPCAGLPDKSRRVQRSGPFRTEPDTATEAERLAMFNTLATAYKLGAKDVLLQTDCLVLVDRGEDCPKYRKAKVKHWPGMRVSFRHVKGHTDTDDARSYANRWCDAEAKKVMRAERSRRRGKEDEEVVLLREDADGALDPNHS